VQATSERIIELCATERGPGCTCPVTVLVFLVERQTARALTVNSWVLRILTIEPVKHVGGDLLVNLDRVVSPYSSFPFF
jgi:hypothetical protein